MGCSNWEVEEICNPTVNVFVKKKRKETELLFKRILVDSTISELLNHHECNNIGTCKRGRCLFIDEQSWKVYGFICHSVQIGGWVDGSKLIRTLFKFRNPYRKMTAPKFTSWFTHQSLHFTLTSHLHQLQMVTHKWRTSQRLWKISSHEQNSNPTRALRILCNKLWKSQLGNTYFLLKNKVQFYIWTRWLSMEVTPNNTFTFSAKEHV